MSQVILINGPHAPSTVRFRGQLIRTLSDRGYEVHVTAPDFDEMNRQDIRDLGGHPHDVPLRRSGLEPLADARYFSSIRRLLKETGASLCFSYAIKPNIWPSLAARSLGVRSASMVTGLGYAFEEGHGIKERLVKSAARRLYRAATATNDVVIFQNPDDPVEFIKQGCLADSTKVRVVNGSGVDLSVYSPVALPPKPVFLMICRLIAAKGVREYAQAAAKVRARHGTARLLLVGMPDDGPDAIGQGELQSWQDSGVEYLGALDDVRPAIAQASVFVLPSFYREGVPRSILEAMAMGRPVVTTDMPGCRETVLDGVTGFLVPPRDTEALAGAMEHFVDDPGLAATMGALSLDLCRSKFDVDAVNQDMIRYLSLR